MELCLQALHLPCSNLYSLGALLDNLIHYYIKNIRIIARGQLTLYSNATVPSKNSPEVNGSHGVVVVVEIFFRTMAYGEQV